MNGNGQPIAILVADDDADDRLLIEEAFVENRIRNPLHFVEDGEQLMAYLRIEGEFTELSGHPYPGLILLDLNMPRKDGREALAEMKREPAFSSVPVVVLTTSREEEDVVRTYNLGVSSFITKPVLFEDLVKLTRVLSDYWIELVRLPPQCLQRM